MAFAPALAVAVFAAALASQGFADALREARDWLLKPFGIPRAFIFLAGLVTAALVVLAVRVGRLRRGWPPRRPIRKPKAEEFKTAFLDLLGFMIETRSQLRVDGPVDPELESEFLRKRRRVLAARDEIIDDLREFIGDNPDYDLRQRGSTITGRVMAGGPERPFAEIWETPVLAAVPRKTAHSDDQAIRMLFTEHELNLDAFVRWVGRTDGKAFNPLAGKSVFK